MFERLKQLLYDDRDLTPQEQLGLLAESGNRAGWDDPEMDVYDNYDENRQTAFAFEAEDERRQAEANRRYWDRRLAKITEELEAIEEDIFSAVPAREKIERIYRLRSGLLNMRHAVAPMIEICNQLRRHDFPGRTSAIKPYLRDVHDHVLLVNEAIVDCASG